MNAFRREYRRSHGYDCTGMNDLWCPIHGDCTCPNAVPDLESKTCPLHGLEVLHAADRWFVYQISPTHCAIAEYLISPKQGDERWYLFFYHGEQPGGGVLWRQDLPPADCWFRRDEPGLLPWSVDE